MGRTNPTFRDLLRATEERWQPYRRALRAPDQPRFDRLFEDARAHADAAGYQNHEEPLFPVVVSVLLEQQRRIDELRDRVNTLETCRAARDATAAEPRAEGSVSRPPTASDERTGDGAAPGGASGPGDGGPATDGEG